MSEQERYSPGERVPVAGTYRCQGCGEIWVADDDGIRFPPCDACKEGDTHWVLESEGS